MSDWKARIGYMIPSWNTVMEYETMRMAPPGVSVHFARIPHTSDDEAVLLKMIDEAPHVAETLAHANMDAICFGCTGGSFVRPGADQDITERIQKHTGIPAATTATALVEALKAVGARRVVIVSPYPVWLNERLAGLMKRHGLEVLAARGLGDDRPAKYPPEKAAELVRETDVPEADAVFVSCTNFRSLEVIEPLERELGKPVISSNTSALWKMLRLIGIRDAVPGAGQLFTRA
jgi:maleate isomerase